KKLDQFATSFRNDWRAKTDCAPKYVIPDCRNGREDTQSTPTPTSPGQKKPIRGATHAAPPALDGTGAPLAGAPGGSPGIGGSNQQQSSLGGGIGGLAGGGASTQTAALALGGAPQKGAGL